MGRLTTIDLWNKEELDDTVLKFCKQYVALLKKEIRPFRKKHKIPDDFDSDSCGSEKEGKEYDDETVEKWGQAWDNICYKIFKKIAKGFPEFDMDLMEDCEGVIGMTITEKSKDKQYKHLDSIHYQVSYGWDYSPKTVSILSSFCGLCGRDFNGRKGKGT